MSNSKTDSKTKASIDNKTEAAPNKSVTAKQPKLDRGKKRVKILLEAAESVFAEHSYGAASMNAIAQNAHSSIGSLYQFFPSKEAIGGELVNRYVLDLAEAWQLAISTTVTNDWQSFADTLIDATFECIDRHPAFATLEEAQSGRQLKIDSRTKLTDTLISLIIAQNGGNDQMEYNTIGMVTLQVIKSTYAIQKASTMCNADIRLEFSWIIGQYLNDRLS